MLRPTLGRRDVSWGLGLGLWLLFAPALGTAQAAGSTQAASAAPQAAEATKNDYGKGDAWICRPGRQDACAADLTTTVIAADGKMTAEKWTANPNAPIDCFYVYPTISEQETT